MRLRTLRQRQLRQLKRRCQRRHGWMRGTTPLPTCAPTARTCAWRIWTGAERDGWLRVRAQMLWHDCGIVCSPHFRSAAPRPRCRAVPMPWPVADLRQSLKVFSNTTMVSVQRLLDEPVAVTAYHSKQDGAVALVAVATGSALYVYRSMRAYFKFALPQPPVDVQEATVWQQLRSGLLTTAAAVEALVDLRDRGVRLTTLTRTLLALDGADTMAEFVQSNAATKLEHHDSIVCMTVLQKATADPGSPSCLVLGTECGIVYVLSPDLSSTDANVLARVELPSTPTHLTVAGVRDVLYRITVACRDGNVYSIKNGEVRVPPAPRAGLPRLNARRAAHGRGDELRDAVLWAGSAGQERAGRVLGPIRAQLPREGQEELHAADARHHHQPRFPPHSPQRQRSRVDGCTCIRRGGGGCAATLCAAAAHHALAALSAQVRMYNERSLLHTISLGEPVTAIKFGLFSRESNSLVMVTRRGSLHVRILKR